MESLRDRLIELADANDDAMQGSDWAEHKMRTVVLAAARIALEELEARNKHLEGRPHTFASENADRYRGFRDGAIACQNTIRALRDSLADV